MGSNFIVPYWFYRGDSWPNFVMNIKIYFIVSHFLANIIHLYNVPILDIQLKCLLHLFGNIDPVLMSSYQVLWLDLSKNIIPFLRNIGRPPRKIWLLYDAIPTIIPSVYLMRNSQLFLVFLRSGARFLQEMYPSLLLTDFSADLWFIIDLNNKNSLSSASQFCYIDSTVVLASIYIAPPSGNSEVYSLVSNRGFAFCCLMRFPSNSHLRCLITSCV